MSPFPAAWALRQPLHDEPETDAYRLFDGRFEGAPGWTVDRYGPVALIQRFAGAEDAPELPVECRERGLAVVLQDRGRRAPPVLLSGVWPPPEPHLPRPGRFVIREEGLRFGVDLLHGANTGLFLDARPMRRWVRQNSRGRRLLNLFSYTAAFGVAASAGGARSAQNIDQVPSALERGRINHLLNELPVDPRSHQRGDVFETLRQGRKRGRTWDGVICDPPPVRSQGGKKAFDPRRDLPRLLRRCWEAVAPGGWMLALCAVPGRAPFEDALPDGPWSALDRGADFPGPREAGARAWLARRPA